MPLNHALESNNAEMTKRLKYTKDILTHMLNNNNNNNNVNTNASNKISSAASISNGGVMNLGGTSTTNTNMGG